MLKLEQVEFMQSNIVSGHRHKSINVNNPLMAHLALSLEDGWVKVHDTRKDTHMWVPTAQCASLTPSLVQPPEVLPTQKVVSVTPVMAPLVPKAAPRRRKRTSKASKKA